MEMITLEYKGYSAFIGYSVDDKVYFGKIEGIEDLITFESPTSDGLKVAFEEAVDDYLKFENENTNIIL